MKRATMTGAVNKDEDADEKMEVEKNVMGP